jgi:hypothetical protein
MQLLISDYGLRIIRTTQVNSKGHLAQSRKARKEHQKSWNLELNQKQDLLSFASLRENVFAFYEFVTE